MTFVEPAQVRKAVASVSERSLAFRNSLQKFRKPDPGSKTRLVGFRRPLGRLPNQIVGSRIQCKDSPDHQRRSLKPAQGFVDPNHGFAELTRGFAEQRSPLKETFVFVCSTLDWVRRTISLIRASIATVRKASVLVRGTLDLVTGTDASIRADFDTDQKSVKSIQAPDPDPQTAHRRPE